MRSAVPDPGIDAAGSAATLGPPSGVVSALRTTPVKGLRIREEHELMLTRAGAPCDRRFYLIDERSRMVNGKTLGELCTLLAEYDPLARRLALTFPGGEVVEGTVSAAEETETRFHSRTALARLVEGPWSAAVSDFAGRDLRLVEAETASSGVDRGRRGAVTLVSLASVERLAALAGGPVDPRRFRMLVEVTGIEAHEEDGFVGRTVRIGEARVAFRGHVGRCLVTSRCPDSGSVDLPTLDLLASYRSDLETTERLAFGVFGEVVSPGLVRLGDEVVPG